MNPINIPTNRIIVFDGNCNLCNRWVQFVIKRDPDALFKFTATKSVHGKNYIEKYSIQADSIILIEGKQVFIKSNAAIKILKQLNGYWFIASTLLLLPRFIRDFFYTIVAKNRYQWFGKKQECTYTIGAFKERFLD